MASEHRTAKYRVQVEGLKWLSTSVFELNLEKPPRFSFLPGQKISCVIDGLVREYSLASSPRQDNLSFCIRHIPDGKVSSRLAGLKAGDFISISEPYGLFLYRPGKNRVVFVATGTGVAPFVAYAASGVEGYVMLHGAGRAGELYYRDLLQKRSAHYIPCFSSGDEKAAERHGGFSGRVTTFLRERLERGTYDFYLCGNGAMIRDALAVIDGQFPDSRVFTETFYTSD